MKKSVLMIIKKMAMNVCNIPYKNNKDKLYHAILGLNSEAGEVSGILQKEYQGHEIKLDHLKRELGDCLWMLAEACDAIGIAMEEIAQINIEKLKARFPDGFSSEKSIHRKEGDV